MKDARLVVASALLIIAGLAATSPAVRSQVAQSLPYVRLQTTTPGTADGGNLHLSGRGLFDGGVGIGTNAPAAPLDVAGMARVGGFTLASGGGLGKVLTSDASGHGTWQPPGLALPYTGSASAPSASVLTINNTAVAGTGTGATFATASINGRAAFGHATETTGNGVGLYGASDAESGSGTVGLATAFSGTTYGVFGESDSSSGYGVYGIDPSPQGQTFGVYGLTGSPGGFGVYGRNDGSGVGVYGYSSNSNAGYGVYGQAQGSGGAGVRGLSSATSGAGFGGYFLSAGATGYGLVGYATSVSNQTTYGVAGQADGHWGIAVSGYAPSLAADFTVGVQGVSESANGTGVTGWAKSTSNAGSTCGVNGLCQSPGGVGVLGRNLDTSASLDTGVWGQASANTTNGVGVYGKNTGGNAWGVYSNGNFGASGFKSFRIDHPLDPKNKFLRHYCAEGPEPQNVYNGTVRTNAQGVAWVQLPDYFEAINRDYRYQLTVVDDAASSAFVQAKVGRKIRGNRFLVMTNAPFTEVCWEVKGVRNDLWARKYGAPVEEDKVGDARGRYQVPELYGESDEAGLSYRQLRLPVAPPRLR